MARKLLAIGFVACVALSLGLVFVLLRPGREEGVGREFPYVEGALYAEVTFPVPHSELKAGIPGWVLASVDTLRLRIGGQVACPIVVVWNDRLFVRFRPLDDGVGEVAGLRWIETEGCPPELAREVVYGAGTHRAFYCFYVASHGMLRDDWYLLKQKGASWRKGSFDGPTHPCLTRLLVAAEACMLRLKYYLLQQRLAQEPDQMAEEVDRYCAHYRDLVLLAGKLGMSWEKWHAFTAQEVHEGAKRRWQKFGVNIPDP